MIKDDFLDNIIGIIKQHDKFEYVDFKLEVNQDTLFIIYLIEPKFKISFQDKNHFREKKDNEKYNIFGDAIPGKFSLHENFLLTKKSDVYEKLKQWLDIIWKEISLNSPLGLMEEEQEHIDKICEKFESLDGYFTTEEILKIRQELEKFKEELEEELVFLVEDETMRKEEIVKLHRDIETLGQVLTSLKKKGWIRSLTGRVYHNGKRLLELRQKEILNKSDPYPNYEI
ncbi:hypothetical protein O2K51_01510 [Apibacter raozihei]|uniref:hypothetical protein n=1 Tax=Apibacter TaxID=1778601 RepID=UPI000FE2D693|nr:MULTISPECIES: hypothetical protein [Apibacter]